MRLKRLASLVLTAVMVCGLLTVPAFAATITEGKLDRFVTSSMPSSGTRTMSIKLEINSTVCRDMTVYQFPEGTILRGKSAYSQNTTLYEENPRKTMTIQYPFRETVVQPGVLYRFEIKENGEKGIRVVFAECDTNAAAIAPGTSVHGLPEEAGWGLPFVDVPAGYWCGPHIQKVYSCNVMKGTSGNTFSPNGNLTRAALWTMLARIEGIKDGKNVYYTNAQKFVQENGIADGKNPHALVSRQEFAVMLYQYWLYTGEKPYHYNEANHLQLGDPGYQINWDEIRDREDVALYAGSAMEWAVEAGILSGDGQQCIHPESLLTRAHVAKMMDRFMTAWSQYVNAKFAERNIWVYNG